MDQKVKNKDLVDIPEEAKEEAKELIENAFRLFAEHTENISEELAEFNRKREQLRRRTENGARRTKGRIV